MKLLTKEEQELIIKAIKKYSKESKLPKTFGVSGYGWIMIDGVPRAGALEWLKDLEKKIVKFKI